MKTLGNRFCSFSKLKSDDVRDRNMFKSDDWSYTFPDVYVSSWKAVHKSGAVLKYECRAYHEAFVLRPNENTLDLISTFSISWRDTEGSFWKAVSKADKLLQEEGWYVEQ